MSDYFDKKAQHFGRMQAKLEWIDRCLTDYLHAKQEDCSPDYVDVYWDLLCSAIRDGRKISNDWDVWSKQYFEEKE